MLEAKEDHILEISKRYNMDMEELKRVLKETLEESKANMSVCNTALDFLIVNLGKDKHNKNLKQEIKSNILNSGIYHANILDLDVN